MNLMRGKKAALLVAALLVTAATVGCGRSSLRIGWRGSDTRQGKWARYVSFSGVERASFRAQAGEMIEVDYDVEVEEGTLTVELLDPDDDRVFFRTFREDTDDVVTVSAPRRGRYRLRIEGESTKGGYEISWDVRDE